MSEATSEFFPSNLNKFLNPREAVHAACHQLDSTEWAQNMQGLRTIVALARHHQDCLETEMALVCDKMAHTVRNLRSQVARAACMASLELFTVKSKSMEIESEDLCQALLARTTDTNRFLRCDATHALESLCDHFSIQKTLNVIINKAARHQNALVRATAAKLLERFVQRLGYERVFTLGRDTRDKLILTGANLLLEGSQETRNHAKAVFRCLSKHESYPRVLSEVIPHRIFRNVEKILRNIR